MISIIVEGGRRRQRCSRANESSTGRTCEERWLKTRNVRRINPTCIHVQGLHVDRHESGILVEVRIFEEGLLLLTEVHLLLYVLLWSHSLDILLLL